MALFGTNTLGAVGGFGAYGGFPQETVVGGYGGYAAPMTTGYAQPVMAAAPVTTAMAQPVVQQVQQLGPLPEG